MTGEAGSCAPLLIACALRIERAALSGAARTAREAGGPTASVLRTGMGPRAAERALTEALRRPGMERAAVLATGFCAGLVPGMHPGDLFVAEAIRDPRGSVTCTGTALLAEALARAAPGRTVHLGVLTGSDHVVRGQERERLRATGALAVDMESAATLWTATRGGRSPSEGGRPVAAVRVIVDAPEHELVRIGTVRGGISAFRVLRGLLPAFHDWHRSLLLPRR
ncbi:1-hydroxy-2-methyl-2-butenyl 4-diphosphate reductase [Streptomyces sp. RerS4]|uniref:phosphorylase family protein n=1 Tax=Streptomyces sp. RerS4 TaxID=2942449 RepID=UPI00201CA426|nr:1-hydroxy-2-methyl-2-butenyl 4-diphosphate reductase [Streptomyces sp. RerS4]UQX03950.1 1-hydroxy-2-methyl-2-butenyl 4-diphosphate reductase [Streptomyces sp. RerS4]